MPAALTATLLSPEDVKPRFFAVGRDLLKIVAEKVIADRKHLDQRLALRHASAKALRK